MFLKEIFRKNVNGNNFTPEIFTIKHFIKVESGNSFTQNTKRRINNVHCNLRNLPLVGILGNRCY